jgi:hypothetical protein
MNRIDEIKKRCAKVYTADDYKKMAISEIATIRMDAKRLLKEVGRLSSEAENADMFIKELSSELETAVNLSQKLFAHDGGLQIELSQLKTELEQVRREKDAAVKDWKNACEGSNSLSSCDACLNRRYNDIDGINCSKKSCCPEWRGLSGNTGELKANVCDGCKHKGKYENEREYGYPSPCTRCKRYCADNYSRAVAALAEKGEKE